MTPKPIDFTKVEALRKHMMLTSSNMAHVLKVSRMTYYSWIKGQPLKKTNEEHVRKALKQLLGIMTEHNWPTPEVIGMTQKLRFERLLALLDEQQ